MNEFRRGTFLPSWFVLIVLALASIGLMACSSAPPAAPAPTSGSTSPTGAAAAPTTASSQSGGPFIVLDWAGYQEPEYFATFTEKHPDVQPEYALFAEDAEGFAKAASGFQFDLAHPCTNYWELYVQEGLIQPIDTSRLKNWNGVVAKLAQHGVIDGKQYFVPWDWGFESIIYRSDKVTTPPTSWADLWNKEYAGHLSMFDSGESAHIITALSLGFDPWNTTPEQNEQIKQKLLELKPNLLNYWADSTELNQLIASGDAWVAANAWNDAYVVAAGEGIPVEYITPKEGRLGWLCGYAISSNSKNVDLAYDYLDALLEPEAMAAMATANGYGAANAEALPLIDPEVVEAMGLDKPEILDATVFYLPINDEQRELFTGMWSEVKAAP
jgi:spermidine/putrescine-binding protein